MAITTHEAMSGNIWEPYLSMMPVMALVKYLIPGDPREKPRHTLLDNPCTWVRISEGTPIVWLTEAYFDGLGYPVPIKCNIVGTCNIHEILQWKQWTVICWFIGVFWNLNQYNGRTCDVPVDQRPLISDNMCRWNLGYNWVGHTYIEGAPVPTQSQYCAQWI